MHNLQVYQFGDGFRLRLFHNSVFDGEKKVKCSSDLVPTPFFDSDWNRIYAPEILSDEEIEFRKQESIRCSLSRTRNKITLLSLSFQDWKYFCTFTFDPTKVDRYSYDACSRAMQNFLHKLSYHYPDVVYIVVPELHADGAFHFHGLFSHDLPVYFVGSFYSGKAKRKVDTYYVNHFFYDFGFTNCSIVRSQSAVCKYISSYITSDLVSVSKNKRRYWYSYSKLKVNKPLNFLVNVTKCKDFLNSLKDSDFSFGGVFNAGKGFYKFSQCFCNEFVIEKIFDFALSYSCDKFVYRC